MHKRVFLVTIASLSAFALAASAGQSVPLKRVATAGEKAAYTMKIDLVFQGMDVNVTFDTVHTVTKVNSDGSYIVTEETKNQLVLVGGQEMPGGGDEVATMTYAADGSILQMESDAMMGDEYRLANLSLMIWPTKPVEVGSKWETTTKADKDKGTFDTTYAFEVLGREKLLDKDCFKIKHSAKEAGGGGASSSGTTWIEIKTGLAVKSEGEMKQVPIQGMPMDAKYLLQMKK